eukprot:2669056-Prymnesium_polylepis.1
MDQLPNLAAIKCSLSPSLENSCQRLVGGSSSPWPMCVLFDTYQAHSLSPGSTMPWPYSFTSHSLRTARFSRQCVIARMTASSSRVASRQQPCSLRRKAVSGGASS